MPEPLLHVTDLTVSFATDDGEFRAVDRLSFSLEQGETLALVGESGCGKSTAALALLRLIPIPPGKLQGGPIQFGSEDLLLAGRRRLRQIRGNEIGLVPQEPMTSLNPVLRVGLQVAEGLMVHRGVRRRAALAAAVELLRRVGIPDPVSRARAYPHHLSGGMRQRVAIAMALACQPRILILDEPTTALDVTIQSQILELIAGIQQNEGTGILLISHDLSMVAHLADRLLVMYAGRVAEEGAVAQLFSKPFHPYTAGLMAAQPRLDGPRGRLSAIPGAVPGRGSSVCGCPFHPRCSRALERCAGSEPPLEEKEDGRRVACWNPLGVM